MFGLGDDDDEQRMWNMTIFNIPATDKEIEDTPIAVPIILLIIIVGVVIWASI